MQKLRILPLALLSLSVGLMTACDSTSSNSGPSITNLYLDNTALVANGGSTGIHATVADPNKGIQVSFKVVQNGTDITSGFTISYTAPVSTATSWSAFNDGKASIAATSSAVNGADTLVMTVTDASGSGTATQKVPLTVTGGTNGGGGAGLQDIGGVILGAQGATPGSFLDVVDTAAWTSGSNKPYASIDVVFGTDAGGTISLMSPADAYNLDGWSLSGWTTLNTTTIVYSSTALTTSAQVQSAIGNSTAQKAVAQNGWYALYLSTGKYAAIQLTSLSATDRTATVSVEIFD